MKFWFKVLVAEEKSKNAVVKDYEVKARNAEEAEELTMEHFAKKFPNAQLVIEDSGTGKLPKSASKKPHWD